MNIDHPFHFDPAGRTATTGPADHIRDLIEQFLFTSPGERVNRPEFGSGLLALVFEPNSTELAATVELTVQSGLVQWLGDLIEVRAVDVTHEDTALAVEVRYAVLATGETRVDTFTRGGP